MPESATPIAIALKSQAMELCGCSANAVGCARQPVPEIWQQDPERLCRLEQEALVLGLQGDKPLATEVATPPLPVLLREHLYRRS